MWVSTAVNSLLVAVLAALAFIVDSDAARAVLVAGAATMSGLAQWGLIVLPWNRAVERAKWDASQEYAAKVVEANARIGEANEAETAWRIAESLAEGRVSGAVAGAREALGIANERLRASGGRPVHLNANGQIDPSSR